MVDRVFSDVELTRSMVISVGRSLQCASPRAAIQGKIRAFETLDFVIVGSRRYL